MKGKSKNLNLLVQLVATRKVILSSLFLFLLVLLMVNIVFKQNFSFLTQTFNYTSEYTYQLLEQIGSGGRNTHLLVFFPDILMVLLYTVFLIGANYGIYNKIVKNCTLISIITFLPLILSITQCVEIILLTVVLLQYPNQLFTLVQVANIITVVKSILTVVFFLMPIIGLGILGIMKIKKKV